MPFVVLVKGNWCVPVISAIVSGLVSTVATDDLELVVDPVSRIDLKGCGPTRVAGTSHVRISLGDVGTLDWLNGLAAQFMVSAVVKDDDGVIGTVLGAPVGVPATDV